MLQAQPSDQLRDSQAPTLPLGHEANIKASIWNTAPETPTQHESKANIVIASGLDSIHGDFDAVQTTPKTMLPTPMTSRPSTAGKAYYFPTSLTTKDFSASRRPRQPPASPNSGPDATRSAYCFPTPQTAEDSSAGKSPGRSPALSVFSSTSPVKNANQPTQRPLLPSPLSGAQKRPLASEPSPLAHDQKRQRVLPSVPADLPQVMTIAGPPNHCEEQWPRCLPATPASTVMSLFKNRPSSNEKIDVDRVGVRQSKGPGLKINTQATGLTAPLPLKTEPMRGEKLYADFISTHKALREELDQLTHELRSANKRATEAELRARKAENMVYQTNSASFQKFKELENKQRSEIQSKVRACQMLKINLEEQQRRNKALEMRCNDLNRTIEKVKQELEKERQRQLSAFFSEHTKTAQELRLGRF